jgi:hypothetical protein
LPVKKSDYSNTSSGVLEKIVFFYEPHTVNCQNPGHLGSVSNFKIRSEFCDACDEYGAPMKSKNTYWTIPKLLPMPTTCSVFFVFLVSRSSRGRPIPQSIFESLQSKITVSPCREKPPKGISNKDYRGRAGTVFEEVDFGFEGVGKRLEMAAEMKEFIQKALDFESIHTKNGKYNPGEINITYSLECYLSGCEEKKILFQKACSKKNIFFNTPTRSLILVCSN